VSSDHGLCGSCGAFVPFGQHPTLGAVGTCARNIRSFPVTANGMCSEYRPRGTGHERLRAPGTSHESRGRDRASSPRALPLAPSPLALPKEIDLDMDMDTFRAVLTQVLREELGVGEQPLGARWQGGELILKPGKEGTAEKRMPIETFFHKVIMLRDKLRVLEQRINAHATMSDEEKVALQQYVTGCYGTLTSFNVLFADPVRQGFRGASGKDE
jgi:hypothetical protein